MAHGLKIKSRDIIGPADRRDDKTQASIVFRTKLEGVVVVLEGLQTGLGVTFDQSHFDAASRRRRKLRTFTLERGRPDQACSGIVSELHIATARLAGMGMQPV